MSPTRLGLHEGTTRVLYCPPPIVTTLPTMTFERFEQLWDALVTNRAPASVASAPLPISNGVSKHTVDALIAAADGDFSHFEKIQPLLSSNRKG